MQIQETLEDSASSTSRKSKLPQAPVLQATECHWMIDEFAWITQSLSGHILQHPAFTWEQLLIRTAAIAVVAVDIIDPAVTIADLAAISIDPAATTRITTHLATRVRTAAK